LKTHTSASPRRARPEGRRRPRPASSRPQRSVPPPVAIEPTGHDAEPIEFTALGLDPRLQRAIDDRGFTRTTPIQTAAIPIIRAGGDLIGCAQTGTGKTAAFLLPIMERLLRPGPDRTRTRVLILAPTRELALQIEEDFQWLAYHTDLSAAAVFGGVPSGPQERALRAPVDVVVATPGRLLDHMGCGLGKFEGVEVLVLDEADRMLDMGFWPSVRRIVAAMPETRQTLLFSATVSREVVESAAQIMRDPEIVQVGRSGLSTTITHHAHQVVASEKVGWLVRFLRGADGPAIVFVRTKRGAERLASRLASAGVRCAALHADRTQSQRLAAVAGFRAGRYQALIATDVAARGLDIEGVAHVVNYDIPDTADAYVHRVGRTGRADASGTAVTLIDPQDVEALRHLERSLNISVPL
jgi:ATP-dependent RNA helicase RhlE